jgi:SPP1 family phage portal protein
MDLVKIIKEDIINKKNKYAARKYFDYNPNNRENGDIDIVGNDNKIHTIYNKNKGEFYTNYFELIVNQKIDYLLAKEPTINKNDLFSITDLTDMLEDLLLNASLDTVSWLHFYVEDNILKSFIVDDREIIPFYDKYKKKIITIIRYWLVDEDTYYVEIWNDSGVTTYNICKDVISNEIISTHYETISEYNGEIEKKESLNFKDIPFIPLFNNKRKRSDLNGIKELLDMYNSISSGFINNVYEFQEMLMKLRGFSGGTDILKETMENMKKYKVVSLPDERADADYISVQIPVEARQVLLTALKENIFLISQSVDPTQIGDGNITNVVIDSRYAALDMKANRTEKQIKLFYEKFAEFVSAFYFIKYRNEIFCNRSMIFNQTEQIKNCIESLKLISKRTSIENHPWVSSVDDELKKIEDEKEKVPEDENDKVPEDENDKIPEEVVKTDEIV